MHEDLLNFKEQLWKRDTNCLFRRSSRWETFGRLSE